MASPFSIFRKHQRILMVALVVLAMFAFTLSDLFSTTDTNLPLLCLLLGSGILAAAGWARGKVVEYAAIGAVAGLAIGFVGPMFAGTDALVTTDIGDYSEEDIQELVGQRSAANQFVQAYWAAADRKSQLEQWKKDEENEGKSEQEFDDQFQARQVPRSFMFGFGRQISQDVILGQLLRNEGQQFGVSVSDAAINSMIGQLSEQAGEGLSKEEFSEVRKRVQYQGRRISESELFEILRDQLTEKMAAELLFPRIPPTPDRYWQMFQRLNIEQELEVVQIPVQPFADLEADPSEAELQEFFEQHKAKFPNQEKGGEPGFRQPPRVALAYLEVDYLECEKLVGEISDARIKEFYEANKEQRYKNFIPESESSETPAGDSSEPNEAGSGPALISPDLPDPNAGASEAKGDAPDGAAKSGDDNPETDQKPGDKDGADGATQDDPSSSSTEPESPAREAPPNGDGCQEDVPETAAGQDAPQDQPQSSETTSGETTSVETTSGDAGSVSGQAASPESSDEPAGDSESAAGSESETPATEESETPTPQYQPLEAVRDDIRDELLQDETKKLVEKKMQMVLGEMRQLSRQYYTLDPETESRGITSEEIQNNLKKLADGDAAIRYVETKRLSYQDMTSNEDYTDIGQATNPNDPGMQSATVAEELFASENRLYTLRQAETVAGNQVGYWVIQEVPSHVPESLSEVKDEVVASWKLKRAYEAAEKRAEEVESAVISGLAAGSTFEASLGEETLIQGSDDQPLSGLYNYTQPFTWLRQSSAPATGLSFDRPVEISRVSGVDGAGGEFMEYVFDTLGDEGIGVVPAYDQTSLYVVQVKNRRALIGNERTGFERLPISESGSIDRLRQQFLSDLSMLGSGFFQFMSPLPKLVSRDQQQVAFEWSQQLEEKYNVKWAGLSAQ